MQMLRPNEFASGLRRRTDGNGKGAAQKINEMDTRKQINESTCSNVCEDTQHDNVQTEKSATKKGALFLTLCQPRKRKLIKI